ncbi:MAG TPA: 50S ribosomal protein L25 [Longimicrobiaceae bacterium]|nr:50S ribosomal protein L25 [Longimicrobiaceae bacterium]
MEASLNARPRDEHGKGAARKLRAAGRVPVIVYGHGDQTRSLSVDALELEKLLARISVENTLLQVTVEGGETTRTLIREVQMHPFKPEVLHLDLLQVHAGERIRLQIPVRLVGTPDGVRNGGGVMDQVLYDLEVECLPRDIPDAIDVDVSGLGVGESARVHDVSVPDVKVLNDPDLPIVSVLAPTVQAAEVEPAVETGTEPELVRDRTAEASDVEESA